MSATTWPANNHCMAQCGVGFKPGYYTQLRQDQSLGWLEIHAENYMGNGGPAHQMLRDLHSQYAISCHGVGLSLGSAEKLDSQHLARLRHLIDWLKPDQFSEHLAWSSHKGCFYNDLLPIPYTKASLQRLTRHISQTQDYLGRKLLLENPAVYIEFDQQDYTEQDFLQQLVQRTSCGLLLDVNNVYVSCTNRKTSPRDYLHNFPFAHVGEVHLAGHEVDEATRHETLLIDSHSCCVIDPVWELFADAIRELDQADAHFLVMIEWDNKLPEWEVLYDQARQASMLMHKVLRQAALSVPVPGHG